MKSKRFFVIISIVYLIVPQTVSAEKTLKIHGGTISFSSTGFGGGGRSTSIAVDPNNSNTVLIGSDVAGVHKSADGGKTYALKAQGLQELAVADIVFLPSDSKILFLLNDGGLYRSSDNGETWRKVNDDVSYTYRYPGSSLLLSDNERLLVATDTKGVFSVTLKGSYRAMPLSGLGGALISAITLHGTILYAATERGVFKYSNAAWQPVNQGLPPEPFMTDITSHSRKRLFAVEKSTGLYVYNDESNTWEHRPVRLFKQIKNKLYGFKSLSVHPVNPDLILLASHPEKWPYVLYRSENGGRKWNIVKGFSLLPSAPRNWTKNLEAIEEIAFAQADPSQVYLADWWNVWHSTDSGKTWTQRHRGLQNTCVLDIKADSGGNVLYACTADCGLMVSSDRGRSWKRKMKGVVDGHAQELEISRQNPSKLYLLMNPWFEKGRIFVYKSRDGGATWNDISVSLKGKILPQIDYVDGLSTNLEIDPKNDETVYVATNGYGIYKTTNGGKEWQARSHGIETPYIKGPGGLLIDPRDPDTIYASTLGGGVYKTIDNGGYWVPVSMPYRFTFGMTFDPSNPRKIIACCPEKKIILSENRGLSWKEIALPGGRPKHVAANAVAIDPQDSKTVYVGTLAYYFKTAEGLFISRDGGQSFVHSTPIAPSHTINCLAAVRDTVFIGYSGIGMYRGRLRDATVPSVQ